jgi:glycosyltransferase
VAGQTVPTEHIIIDGCSSDGTIPTIEALQGKAPQIISEPDQGIYDAMNKGIRLASGDIIGILNADDVYSDERVLERVRRALANQAYQACYGDLVYVANNDLNDVRRYWRSGTFDPKKLYWGWMPPHPTFFVRRSVYESYGLFDLSLGSSADYELMLRFLLKHAVPATYIPKVLVRMRLGGVSNRSIRNRFIAHIMDYRAWRVNGLTPYPWTLLFKPLRKLPQFVIPPPSPAA